jgi:hypothetical protein
MDQQVSLNQFGDSSLLINNNNGDIYIGGYVTDAASSFKETSMDLLNWRSTLIDDIHIDRGETNELYDWIFKEADTPKKRVALLVGNAGIGKSVVLHDLLVKLQTISKISVLALKADQLEFADADDLRKKIHLAKPIQEVLKETAKQVEKVVLLIDQIDALSFTLSSNRTPLRSLMKLVELVSFIPNARIIISCRPYDLAYDPILEQFRFGYKQELHPLNKDKVSETLGKKNIEIEETSPLFEFLRNPLYLYLFLKVGKSEKFNDDITEQILYNELWDKYIKQIGTSTVDAKKLVNLLDILSKMMYERQSLTIGKELIDTNYAKEFGYLCSSDIITKTLGNKVQFFHQSLFDYVFSRRFVETRKSLLNELENEHQGLFIRARVKHILSFIRENDENEYIQILNKLLFDKDKQGRDKFRYHLKLLVLTTWGFNEKISQTEIDFVKRILVQHDALMRVFVDAIYSKSWFKVMLDIVQETGGWKIQSLNKRQRIINLCYRLLWKEPVMVLLFVNDVLKTAADADDRQFIVNMLNSYRVTGNANLIKSIYKQLVTDRRELILAKCLNFLIQDDPDFVISELEKNMEAILNEHKADHFLNIDLSHEVGILYKTLKSVHPDKAFKFFLNIVGMIVRETEYEWSGKIKSSSAYINFTRISNPAFGDRIAENLLSDVFDQVENRVDINDPEIANQLRLLVQTRQEILMTIAVVGYCRKPHVYLDDIFFLLTDKEVMEYSPTLLSYYVCCLFQASFACFDYEHQSKLIENILQLSTDFESRYINKDHLKYNDPITQQGRTQAVYLNHVPQGLLHDHFPQAYKKLQEYQRRYKNLENKMPFETNIYKLPTMRQDEVDKMTVDQWLNSMRKYNTDIHEDWDRPTKTGQSMLFKSVVKNKPKFYAPAIYGALRDKSIPLEYVIAGLEGWQDGNYEIKLITKLFTSIVNQRLDVDINKNKPAYVISLVRTTSYFIKQDILPEPVVNFLCNVTLHFVENRDVNDETESAPYNSGINQVRGAAASELVKCYGHPKYKDKIFESLEAIAKTASIHTRSAILLRMALLNHLDKERNLQLFLDMMYDYRPNLMAMPFHDLNPLCYFINYGFDRLTDFFKKSIDIPVCHEPMVLLLWMAFVRQMNGSQDLLNEMCEKSPKARVALINYFCTLNSRDYLEDELPYLNNFLAPQYVDEDLANVYDLMFDCISSWTQIEKVTFTNLYLTSPMSHYAYRQFYKYLGEQALVDPHQCLRWLKQLYDAKSAELKEYYSSSKFIEILIQAYNGIKQFNRSDKVLEEAMDLLDVMLSNQENRVQMTQFLNSLDNE